jgi:RHS repeat-associated protein
VWKAAFLPFGRAQILTETITSNIRFPGQYFDAETGLHYNWNRYYNPETGRYLTPDPIGLAGGLNLFAYVEGDPVNWVDPEGLKGLNWRPHWRGKTPGWQPNRSRKPNQPKHTPSDLDRALQQLLPDPADPNSKPFIIPSLGKFVCIEYECKKIKNTCKGDWYSSPFLSNPGWRIEDDSNCRCKKTVFVPFGVY